MDQLNFILGREVYLLRRRWREEFIILHTMKHVQESLTEKSMRLKLPKRNIRKSFHHQMKWRKCVLNNLSAPSHSLPTFTSIRSTYNWDMYHFTSSSGSFSMDLISTILSLFLRDKCFVLYVCLLICFLLLTMLQYRRC